MMFLLLLQNDPWGAARYYAEAEKQEELAENTATELNVSKHSAMQFILRMIADVAVTCQA
jgi:hypothetical protein